MTGAVTSAVSAAPLGRPWAWALGGVVVSVLVLAATWWILERADDRLPSWERQTFTAINRWPDSLAVALWPVMQLGNFWVWLVGSVVSYAVWRRPAPAIAITIATLAAWGLAKVVKDVVARARPGGYLADVRVREGGIEGFGYVSGHAAVSCALATALAPWLDLPWLIVVTYVLTALVALARIYVGAHFPLDVAGGAAIGIACGLAALLVVGAPDLLAAAGG